MTHHTSANGLIPSTPSTTAMKLVAALVLLFSAAPAFAQTSAPVAHPEIRAELAERFAAEQDVRMRLIASGGFTPDSLAAPSPALAALLAEMTDIDADNLAFVEAMIETHGWPTPALVGPDGVSATFLIVQHADAEVQERVLPLAEAAWRAGDFMGQQYALLLDRVLVSRGDLQVYGTQADVAPDGTMSIPVTIDNATLDARRAEVGLPPIADYMEMMHQMYRSAPAGE